MEIYYDKSYSVEFRLKFDLILIINRWEVVLLRQVQSNSYTPVNRKKKKDLVIAINATENHMRVAIFGEGLEHTEIYSIIYSSEENCSPRIAEL